MRFGYKFIDLQTEIICVYKYRYEDVLDSQLNLKDLTNLIFYRINSRAFQDLGPSIDKQKNTIYCSENLS